MVLFIFFMKGVKAIGYYERPVKSILDLYKAFNEELLEYKNRIKYFTKMEETKMTTMISESYVFNSLNGKKDNCSTFMVKLISITKEFDAIGWILTDDDDDFALFCLRPSHPHENYIRFERVDGVWITKSDIKTFNNEELNLFSAYMKLREAIEDII